MMADKPVLFSGPMVRALLAGTKTQTRRTMKVKPSLTLGEVIAEGEHSQGMIHVSRRQLQEPRISIGDRLYVREHWRTVGAAGMLDATPPRDLEPQAIWYVADGEAPTNEFAGKFRQGMHMPRWASRITLTVTDVRVERLQDISEADAVAEGVAPFLTSGAYVSPEDTGNGQRLGYSAYDLYRNLWNSINGPGSWEANPWVAAYIFTVQMGNIDQLAQAA